MASVHLPEKEKTLESVPSMAASSSETDDS
jgi:hypothetical protein